MGQDIQDKGCFNGRGQYQTFCESTGIDRWFIYQIQKICVCEKEIAKYDLKTLPDELLTEAKFLGFSDEQIVRIMKEDDAEIIYNRRKAWV
jgi:carbamoyl-phosphate synthase large subunit